MKTTTAHVDHLFQLQYLDDEGMNEMALRRAEAEEEEWLAFEKELNNEKQRRDDGLA